VRPTRLRRLRHIAVLARRSSGTGALGARRRRLARPAEQVRLLLNRRRGEVLIHDKRT
jgi:hypothetical protein